MSKIITLTVSNKSEPTFGKHIDTPPICTQDSGSLYPQVVLITRDGDLVYKLSTVKYMVNNKVFTLLNDVLYYDGLSLPLPDFQELSVIERLYLGLGYEVTEDATSKTYDIDLKTNNVTITEILEVLMTMALKDNKLLNNNFTSTKQHKYGRHLFHLYKAVVTGSGRIRSTNQHLRFFNERDTLQLKSKLFNLSDEQKYKVGAYSMKYTPTEILEALLSKIFEYFQQIRFKENSIVLEPLDFALHVNLLPQLPLRDFLLLMSDCVGYGNDSFIIRPKLLDYQQSRVYSVFTSIKSDTRKLLGFTNYDIGSALQTITLQLVSNPALYPLHQQLADDKHKFRAEVMQETGKDLSWVKTELSKIDNLDKMPKRYDQYPLLKAYCAEAMALRQDVLNSVEKDVLKTAKLYAKEQWKKIWNDECKEYLFVIDGNKESSIYFFIWTQYERQIREAMMECFTNSEACYQVHDAVYSSEQVDIALMEEHIFEKTGFKVKISH